MREICSACVVRLHRFHGKKGFLQETGIPAGLLFYAEMGSQAKSLSKIPFVLSAAHDPSLFCCLRRVTFCQ